MIDTTTKISAAILLGLTGAVLGWKRWRNKDTAGVALGVWLVFLASLMVTCSGCASAKYRPELDVGLHWETRAHVYGANPVGTVRLAQPLWVQSECTYQPWLWAEFEHHSSVPDYKDVSESNQLGLVFAVPLGRIK